MAKHHSKHHDGMHHGKHHHEKEHERKKGGRVGMWVSGNPDVEEEAKDDEDGAETGHERKHGGRAKKHKKHHHRATGGKVLGLMTGGGVRPRLDRPGRKRGGAVGANRSPLSTAHSGGHGTDGSSNPRDSYGGTPP